METWTRKDIVKLTGLKEWQVKYATDTGIVKPVFLGGRGNARHYDKDSIYNIMIISELMNFGITAAQSKNIIKNKKISEGEKITVDSEFSTLVIDTNKIINKLG